LESLCGGEAHLVPGLQGPCEGEGKEGSESESESEKVVIGEVLYGVSNVGNSCPI
jgi:hypothetical protein